MNEPTNVTRALSERYVIQHEIGSGGMAVVYLAHDRKLDREVALKVLRPELGAVLGAERFLAEIKISARLDHPHILTLIDSGDADGMLYYVLPYVRGETLRDKLNREHQLSLDEALAITKQVAGALDYAHRQGFVHRDIKPENILLQEGEAMLTDFGIALAVKEAGGNRLTQTGLSLGTPQYMSPEQATGDRGIDARSDVYSLASVLYEMLAGEPPVTGASAQAMIAKLMTEHPTRLRVLRDTVPVGVDAAVSKALAKIPADRYASAEEFVRALDNALAQPTPSGTQTGSRRRTMLVAAGVVLVLGIGGAAAVRTLLSRPSARAALGQKTQLTVAGDVRVPAISPDGKQLAYVTRQCAATQCTYSVMVQDVGGSTTRGILEGATTAYYLVWSPDRRNLLFVGTMDGHYGTYLVSALGGQPRLLTAGAAAFYAGGDSLLIGSSNDVDSLYWIRVTGLDGTGTDSIAVRGEGQGLASISVVPGTQWILTLILQQPHGLWQVIDRSGKVADHVVNACTCGGIATRDAVWLDRDAGAAGDAIVRIALDRATGHLASQQDTMLTALFTNVSLTDDGAKMVMDMGTLDYRVWALDFADVLQGRFPDDRVIARASNSVTAAVSPDGSRLLIRRAVPTGGGQTEVRYSLASFAAGSETPVTAGGQLKAAWWIDSVTVATRSLTAQGTHLALQDVGSHAERSGFDFPDSTLRDVDAIPGGWAWIPASGDRIMIRQNGQTRNVSMPAGYASVFTLTADGAASRLAFAGWDAATHDSLLVSLLTLGDGSVTRWAAVPADGGYVIMPGDASVLLTVYEGQESLAFFKLTAPGQLERLGSPPRPLLGVSVAADLKRATAIARDYRADAWIYDVVRY